ncbi:cupin domain-containing protein [Mycobacterium sp. IS-1590]|uniref:cupin domain-containing protein n=1 Tax=Mycobacterium sp. IS-1590 TaxID=1772286 RepID=UPI000B1202F8|nr:cupin domain-containing protein [Mycobacterium sp. IS-1590]
MTESTSPMVYAPDDIVWHQTDLGRAFWVSDDLVGTQYSTLFSAQLTKFGPGGGSTPHHHDYNHTFFFLTGTACLRIGGRSWDVTPGTFVKVPANAQHSLTNTGTEDLVFLVIYDPPHVATD